MNLRHYLRTRIHYYSRILGIRFLYERLIQPRNTQDDIYRKEYVLNTILIGIISLFILLGISIIWSLIHPVNDYSGIHPVLFLGIIGFFIGLLILSRKGYWQISAVGLVTTLLIIITYAVIQWSFIVPMTILGSLLVIVISGILFSNRTGFIITLGIILMISGITLLQTTGHLSVHLYWQQDPISVQDVIEMGFILLCVSGISWLSNRETERSLARAINSEHALVQERNLLEQRVEERTTELKTLQYHQTQELGRLAEFGNLSSGIFHDLMTPLTSIIALIDQIPEGNVMTESLKPELTKAIGASKKIGEHLNLIRKEIKPTVSVTYPAQEIADAVAILAYQLRVNNIHCIINCHSDTPITVNSTLFHRVLINLIVNAVDAYKSIPFHDEENISRRRTISIDYCVTTSLATLSVTDFGCGVSESDYDKIFNEYYSTKTLPSQGGLGIGLYHIKQIVEREFQGLISVTSSPALGTVFTVTFPINHAS